MDDLLSFNKNKHLFDSKNQFKLLNKRKSSILTKIYMILHIDATLPISYNINASFKTCYVAIRSKESTDDTSD